MKAFANYILRGRLQAGLVAVGSGLLSLILVLYVAHPVLRLLGPLIPLLQIVSSYVSGATIGLVTLRHGLREGGYVLLPTAAIMAVLAMGILSDAGAALGFILALWLPVWLLAAVLRKSASMGLAVQCAVLMGGAFVVGVYLVLPDPAQWWREMLGLITSTMDPEQLSMSQEERDAIINMAAPRMTGVFTAMEMVGVLTSLLLARWWQAMLFRAGEFQREFYDLRLGRSMALVLVGLIAVSVLNSGSVGVMASDIVLVIIAGFTLHGLALLHGVVAAAGANVAWLVGAYILMVVALPVAVVAMATAAVVDSWFDFRSTSRTRGGSV